MRPGACRIMETGSLCRCGGGPVSLYNTPCPETSLWMLGIFFLRSYKPAGAGAKLTSARDLKVAPAGPAKMVPFLAYFN